MNTSTNRIIPALTGLRAIAAYMVFFHHFPIGSDIVGAVAFNMQWQLQIGVTVFFVLSGFVIAFNYADSVTLNLQWYGAFLLNRFARIYPLYFLLTVLAMLYLQNYDTTFWVMNLTLLRGFFGEYYFYHISQAWSLSVELVFYLLAPGLLLLVGRIPVGALCLAFYGLGYLLTMIEPQGSTFMEPMRMVVVNTFFGRCFEFLLGIWLYKRFRDSPVRPGSWLTIAGAASILGLVSGSAFVTELTVYSPDFSPAHHFVFPLCVALFIAGLWKESSFISRWLGSRLMVTLGSASYAFYLLHAAPFEAMLGLDKVPIAVHFLVINLLAILCYYQIEKPLQRRLRARSPLPVETQQVMA